MAIDAVIGAVFGGAEEAAVGAVIGDAAISAGSDALLSGGIDVAASSAADAAASAAAEEAAASAAADTAVNSAAQDFVLQQAAATPEEMGTSFADMMNTSGATDILGTDAVLNTYGPEITDILGNNPDAFSQFTQNLGLPQDATNLVQNAVNGDPSSLNNLSDTINNSIDQTVNGQGDITQTINESLQNPDIAKMTGSEVQALQNPDMAPPEAQPTPDLVPPTPPAQAPTAPPSLPPEAPFATDVLPTNPKAPGYNQSPEFANEQPAQIGSQDQGIGTNSPVEESSLGKGIKTATDYIKNLGTKALDKAAEDPLGTLAKGLAVYGALNKPSNNNILPKGSIQAPIGATISPNFQPSIAGGIAVPDASKGAGNTYQTQTYDFKTTPKVRQSYGLAAGGYIENQAAQNAVGSNDMYPMAGIQTSMYSNPSMQRPMASDVLYQPNVNPVDPLTGQQKFVAGGIARFAKGGNPLTDSLNVQAQKRNAQQSAFAAEQKAAMPTSAVTRTIDDSTTASMDPYAASVAKMNQIRAKSGLPPIGGAAGNPRQSGTPLPFPQPKAAQQQAPMGGIGQGMEQEAAKGGLTYGLGGYSDGGRLLKGPGDGMSDDIPASIGHRQPARLADGEFVVPADVVSHLGNGSTDAGAKKLYAMMDKVRHARTGNKKQGRQINADKFLPK